MSVRFTPAAQKELDAAVVWYLNEAGEAIAEEFRGAVLRATRLVEDMPGLGTPSGASTRLWPVKGFPYTVVYRTIVPGLVVVAVAHQHRQPRYWEGR